MPILWLKVAAGFYALGLLWSLASLSRPCSFMSRIIMPVMGVGLVFHFVSLVESVVSSPAGLTIASVVDSESLFAFLMLAAFMLAFARYRTTSPGIFLFPLVFLLTFVSTLARQPLQFDSPVVRSGWVVAHIALIFAGYAALFLSFAASLLYLVQERALKSKRQSAVTSRLPSLQTVDDISYKALLWGFPFMTLGLIAGAVVAQASFGASYFYDPKVLLSLGMWVVYVVLLYVRWNSAWRGRRAAYMASFALVAALSAWVANYFSAVHRFLAP